MTDDPSENDTSADSRGNEWGVADDDRIPLDLSGSDDDVGTADDGPIEDDYAPEASSTPIESGDPDLENALFVVLGVLSMVLVIVRLITIPL
ncbi:DUF7312 domain-containing protein [Natrinema longum]|uniref:DUF7312 domain-containing protein n=1 Tax=Natrinema longum TaxID=370324 RepID=A0A8A2U5V2_9EURY|nr:hypothetical protein [Natrinema longum]QSW83832.1 hypothetical protein J0X27_10095 [Natrinema longum]